MTQSLLVMADDADVDEDKIAEGRRRLREAMKQEEAKADQLKDEAEDEVPVERGFTGQKVDKYFGTQLPPVCARLGCYVTDDGQRYYCVNPACQKHKKRDTKHSKRGRPKKGQFAYFRCPRCNSRSLDMHLLRNEYECQTCKYVWKR